MRRPTSGDRLPLLTRLEDRFEDDRPPGEVVGSRTTGGDLRLGVDAERGIGIDHHALRVRFLEEPGWGRAGLVYGPFARTPGLALAVSMLNGHNSSQTRNLPETWRQRARRWYESLVRLRLPPPRLRDNLAVGFFPHPVPVDPTREGSALVMRSADTLGGELRARSGDAVLPLVRGVQNLPLHLVVVLREHGAAYYATSVPGASGLTGHPEMRPLAVDPAPGPPSLFAGVHQCVIGEVGYRIDSRVYGVRVQRLPDLEAWYGTAEVADDLSGAGPVGGSEAEVGGRWTAVEGLLTRGPGGARPERGPAAVAMAHTGPVGLVHVLARADRGDAELELRWRTAGEGRSWSLRATTDGCRLVHREGDASEVVREDPARRLRRRATSSLQVLDDGGTIVVHLDGQPVFGGPVVDDRLGAAGGLAVRARGSVTLRALEAHPRAVRLPAGLDLGAPWTVRGPVRVVTDPFDGPAGDLAEPVAGRPAWRRELGTGVVERTGRGGARVRADREHPNPGRTLYTVPWPHPELADVEVTIIPPGTSAGEGHNGRSGLVLWQDPDHYVVVNLWLDDWFGGASVSTFFHLGGVETMYDYDAVWSNVGLRVRHGHPVRLRVASDGERLMIWLDGEPVNYRALTDVRPHAARLTVRRVGLAVNWEWGDDTGSAFHDFVASGPGGSERDEAAPRP